MMSDGPKLPVLMSYAFLRDRPEFCERLAARGDVELLLDCGAFTAKNAGYEIRLEDYMRFLGEHAAGLFGYLALDVLQDPAATDRNLRTMLDAGLRPVPVHVFGDGAARMDQLFGWSEWVALGGLRRPHRGAAPLPYLKQKMDWAAGRKVHWLGYVRLPAIKVFRPFSCDCSSFSSGMRWGRVDFYRGRGRWLGFTMREALEGRAHLRADVARLLAAYGVPVSDFLDPRYWRHGVKASGVDAGEALVVRVPCRSWVSYVMEMRRLLGTRIFLATLPAGLKYLLDAFDWWKEKYAGLIEGEAPAGHAAAGGDSAAGARLRDDEVRGVSPVAAGA